MKSWLEAVEQPTRHRKRAPRVKPYRLLYRRTEASWEHLKALAEKSPDPYYSNRVERGNIWQVKSRHAKFRDAHEAYITMVKKAGETYRGFHGLSFYSYWSKFEFKVEGPDEEDNSSNT